MRGKGPKLEPPVFILACLALGVPIFLSLELGRPLKPGAHELAVFAGFTVAPLAVLMLTRRKLELGKFDMKFLMGVGLYMLFVLMLLPVIPGNRDFFEGYRMAPGAAVLWALLTYIQVSSVDFFTKRIVQFEVERKWGTVAGMAAQFAAWSLGHIPEYLWLQKLATPAGAVLFLGVTGAATGWLYSRTKNVLGMMLGHWLLNVGLAGISLVYFWG